MPRVVRCARSPRNSASPTSAYTRSSPTARPRPTRCFGASRTACSEASEARRVSPQARSAVARSQEEAVNFGARGVGPEHLLLALAPPEAGASARALAAAGVRRDALLMAAQDTTSVSEPRDRRGTQVPFAPATKKVLELSLREAVRRGDDHIGSEHVLLGLLRSADERTMTILSRTGVTPQAIRDAVDALPRET